MKGHLVTLHDTKQSKKIHQLLINITTYYEYINYNVYLDSALL